jgi:hypothetical protein
MIPRGTVCQGFSHPQSRAEHEKEKNSGGARQKSSAWEGNWFGCLPDWERPAPPFSLVFSAVYLYWRRLGGPGRAGEMVVGIVARDFVNGEQAASAFPACLPLDALGKWPHLGLTVVVQAPSARCPWRPDGRSRGGLASALAVTRFLRWQGGEGEGTWLRYRRRLGAWNPT